MDNEVEELVASISLNQILMAILEEQKQVVISTEKFFSYSNLDKDLVLDYDESGPSFVFSLKEKNEQQ